MYEEKVRKVLGERALLDENDPRIEQKWEELEELLSESEEHTIAFLKTCTKTEITYISEVFEDVAYNLQSRELIKVLYSIDERYPDLELTRHIKTAEGYLS